MSELENQGIQMEELEALANEFTLDDLAEFDNEFEFDVTDLESIKPVYTTKEKLKFILMNNTVFSIIKWCFAGLGLVGLVLFILAMANSMISEKLTTGLSAGVRNVFTTISNLLPVSMLEIVVILTIVGILAYAGFLIYKSIKEKEGIKIIGHWVQFAYALLAVVGTGFLIYTMCYGVTTNRPALYKTWLKQTGHSAGNLFLAQDLDSGMIYYSDRINEVAVDGLSNIYYTPDGNSRYAGNGKSMDEIAKAVNACFDVAAQDLPFLKGKEVKAKRLIAKPLYTAMNIGSIYSPFTSEVLINDDYPEVAIPMQVARAIAKQRGVTDDGDASFIAFIVLTHYSDAVANTGAPYNMHYIKYSAYMDAYLELGNLAYRLDPNVHLYCAAALKESAKKDIVAYVKELDALYNNVSNLEFMAAPNKTSTADYKVLAKLLYNDFNYQLREGYLTIQNYNTVDNPVPARQPQFAYTRYLVNYYLLALNNGWYSQVEQAYNTYNPAPMTNDGSDLSIYGDGYSVEESIKDKIQ